MATVKIATKTKVELGLIFAYLDIRLEDELERDRESVSVVQSFNFGWITLLDNLSSSAIWFCLLSLITISLIVGRALGSCAQQSEYR